MSNAIRREGRKKQQPVSDDELSSVVVYLPSRGVPYGNVMPEGRYEIRPPRISETKYMAQLPDHPELFSDVVTTMLRRLTISPNIDPLTLTAGDRSYLFLWIRAQVDPYYRLLVACPRCLHVNKSYNLLISDIPVKGLTEKYTEPFEYELRKLDKSMVKVSISIEREKDAADKDAAKLELPKEDHWLIDCVTQIRAIDGKPAGSIKERVEWIQKTLDVGEDVVLSEMRKWYDHGPDYDNSPLVCSKCKEKSTFRLPFRRELYFPTVSFKRDFGHAADGGDVREGRDSAGDAGSGRSGDPAVPVGQGQDSEAD